MTNATEHRVFSDSAEKPLRRFFRSVCWPLLLGVSLLPRVCFANDSPPSCSFEPGAPLPPVVQYSGPAILEDDDARFIFRAWDIPKIVIEARYDTSGVLKCASPLSGPSYYWPNAVKALSTSSGVIKAGTDGRAVVVFPDPDSEIMKDFHNQLIPRCGVNEPLDALLFKGRRLLLKQPTRLDEATKCFSLALQLTSGSVAANDGMAVVDKRRKQTDAAVMHYQKVISLRPKFYEARFDHARLVGAVESKDKEEALVKGVLAENPPLPIQEMVFDYLVHFYDQLDRRPEASEAKRSAAAIKDQLLRRNPEMLDWATFYNLSTDRGDLGLRLEEQKRYREAEQSYREALDFSVKTDGKTSQAEIFLWQLGRARSFRQLDNVPLAESICSDWKNKIPRFGKELENFSWHGEGLVWAEWELSCGDFAQGLRMVEAVIRQDAKSRDNGDLYRTAAPYGALETIYRARGESKLARLAQITADRLGAQRDAQVLAQVLQDVRPLFRTNREPELEKDKD